ncbi:MAG TPA: beta-galactosidase trimerization domain-containing protein, partial [Ornithinibacter sp.]|nr:beta-galactosidase trimerization domain-containing protein [Ornithinibacter sp.]
MATHGPAARGERSRPAPGAGLLVAVAGARADVLARYVHPQLGRFPAVTTRAHGLGRVTYVGTVPDRTLGADLVRHLVPTPV